jgi:ParB-like chromosome segregation protein Spo0J
MLKVKRTQKVLLADLHINMFVRCELDQDHVLYLAGLIDNGIQMSARIRVVDRDKQLFILDGRHRKEAYELCGMKEVEVDIVTVTDELELISEAYRANTGGSKPPTIADTEHTVALLLERDESIKSIAELLGLPVSLTRKYTTEVKSRISRSKMQEAVRLVTNENFSAAMAAEKAGVELEKLKEQLSGKRRKRKDEVADMQRNLTKIHKSFGLRHHHLVRALVPKFEDGDVSKKQVDAIFEQMRKFATTTIRNISDWEARFEVKSGNGNGTSGEKSVSAKAAARA